MIETSLKAGRREWVGLAVLTLPALLAAMDLSVLFMAVPWLSADLQPSGTQQLWIMDIYGFMMAGLLITMGTLGDRIGHRRLLMLGALAFGAASLLAAYATSAELMIVARALLGIGGATLAPSTLALIRNLFQDEGQRRAAVGVWAGAFTAGFPAGAIIGGLLVEHFWWGSVFLINLPVMALLLALAPTLLPEARPRQPGRFDLFSAALSIAALLPVVYGVKEFAEAGPGGLSIASVAVGLAIGVGFVRRQLALADPLIDVRLFRHRGFSASAGAYLVFIMASAGLGMLVVQYLQLVLDYRPLVAALWMLPMVASMLVGVSLGPVLVRWLRPGWVVGAGLGLGALGFGLLTRLAADGTIADVLIGYSVLGLGMGVAVTLVVNLVVATAPPERAGAAAAISETSAELGGALGIATLGTIATAVYRSQAESETLAAAVAEAGSLPEPLAEPLLATARDAFASGLSLAAAIGAGLMAVTAVVVAVLLRRVPRSGADRVVVADRPERGLGAG